MMNKETVEAATLPKKKRTISKGKVKKTIRNTLCRPDPVFWPKIPKDQEHILEAALFTYKVELPEYKKPHWKVLKTIPKDQRPKQPKIKKVDGLIFGLNECTDVLKSKECAAVIIEGTINPHILIQPLIEQCISSHVPILCLNGLRQISSIYFGIPSSCLAIKKGYLDELRCKIEDIANSHTSLYTKFQEKRDKMVLDEIKMEDKNTQGNNENIQDKTVSEIRMEIDQDRIESDKNRKENIKENLESNEITEDVIKTLVNFTYLYRTNKKIRVFNPSLQEPKPKNAFIGQDFIKFSDELEQSKSANKGYMGMILKRITSNQNRVKRK